MIHELAMHVGTFVFEGRSYLQKWLRFLLVVFLWFLMWFGLISFVVFV